MKKLLLLGVFLLAGCSSTHYVVDNKSDPQPFNYYGWSDPPCVEVGVATVKTRWGYRSYKIYDCPAGRVRKWERVKAE